jgi:hypothetical protein
VCCLALLLAAANADDPWQYQGGSGKEQTLPFQIVIDEQTSGFETSYESVVRDDRAWRSLWSRVYAHEEPPPAIKRIDFRREMVVVVAAGVQRSGGHRISIDRISVRGKRLEIRYHRSCPGPGKFSTTMLSQPIQAVRVRKTAGTPEYLDDTGRECR